MGRNTTIYGCNNQSDGLAQLCGASGAPALGPTWGASSITGFDPNAGIVHKIAGVAATSATNTLNAPGPGQFGQELILIITDNGGITLTFGTNFATTGTVNPGTGKAIVVEFVSDGVFWIEKCRTSSAVTAT